MKGLLPPRSLPLIIVALGIIAVVALVFFRQMSLHAMIQDGFTKVTAPMEDEVFFTEAVQFGLIFPNVSASTGAEETSQQLAVVPPDYGYTLDLEMAKTTDSPTRASLCQKKELFNKLYNSHVGKAVLKAVRLWNEAHRFVAIRDNRPMADGTTRNQWEARDGEHEKLHLTMTDEAPEFCVFVTGGIMKPGFNDWTRTYATNQNVKLRSRVHLETPKTVTVHVVGTLISVEPVNKVSREDFGLVQRGFDQNKVRATEALPGSSLTFQLEAGEHELTIVAKPVDFSINQIPGMNIAWVAGKEWPEALEWRSLSQNRWREPMPYQILTANGDELVNTKGEATNKAWDLGLAGITGTGVGDRGSLSWIMSGARKSGTLELTIDTKLQQLAQNTLDNKIEEFWGGRKYGDERRGAVVMLDADSGEILAAASYPRVRGGLHEWDLRSFASYYPTKNWRIPRGWKGTDFHSQPGSTFKPVTAMAAISAVEHNAENANEINAFIRGYSKSNFKKTGLTLDCVAYDIPRGNLCYSATRIPNKKLKSKTWVDNFIFKGRRTPLQNSFKDGERTLGLKQAIRDSINIWFVRLAQILDGDIAVRYDDEMRHWQEGQVRPTYPKFTLGEFSESLGFNTAPLDLLANLPEEIRPRRLRPAGDTGTRGWTEGDQFYGFAGKLDLLDHKARGVGQILAKNAYGHGVEVTPLQMARVAASVATGRLPQPVLAKRVNDEYLDLPEGKPLDLDDKGMDLLRSGMKAVVESLGTAHTAFNNHPEQTAIYGKTGTATIPSIHGNSIWFIGWREPVAYDQRRIAFAVFISHAIGTKRTGGTAAAPVVAEIFRAYNQQSTDAAVVANSK